MATRGRDIKLVIGGESRVELLPPEIARKAKSASTRRALAGLVVLAVVVVGGGYAAAIGTSLVSATKLAAVQQETQLLLAEQTKYAEVNTVETELKTAVAAQQLGASTEIDWRAYLESMRALLPVDTAITGFTIQSSTPLQPIAAPTVPLQGPRIAEIVFTATSPDLPKVGEWISRFGELKGFVDGIPGSITLDETVGYSATITLHINQDAYSNRFLPTPPTDATQTTDPANSTQTEERE